MGVVTGKLKPMERAQARIAAKHIFFAALILSTRFIVDNRMPTAATDMVVIYYNEEFVARLDQEELIFLNVHEIMHVLLKHGLRLGGRDRYLWNVACDHVINLKLKELKFKVIHHPEWKDFGPEGFVPCCDPRFVGMSEEQVYDLLMQEEKNKPKEPEGDEEQEGREGGRPGKKGDKPGQGPGKSFNEDILPTPGDKAEQEKVNVKIDRMVATAIAIAKARGELPAGFETIIKDFFEAQVPWEVVLQRFMSKFVRSHSTWRRRNRRHPNMYLPGKLSKQLGEVNIIGDSSGSMFNETIFKYVGSEINYFIQNMKPELVRVVWADDDECSNEEVFLPGEQVVLHPRGGGGTDMRKPLLFIEKNEPIFAIIITDGITPWPNEPTPYPLIICCTTAVPCPEWALTVRVEISSQ